eukprot:6029325-Amphidinium_carterae.1
MPAVDIVLKPRPSKCIDASFVTPQTYQEVKAAPLLLLLLLAIWHNRFEYHESGPVVSTTPTSQADAILVRAIIPGLTWCLQRNRRHGLSLRWHKCSHSPHNF